VVEGFHPTNDVAQGSPLSPILYLLVIQSFISLLNIEMAGRVLGEPLYTWLGSVWMGSET
jgi:hypothetical protein